VVKGTKWFGVNSIVFEVLKEALKEIDFPTSGLFFNEIIGIVRHGKGLSPKIPLPCGCAKPSSM